MRKKMRGEGSITSLFMLLIVVVFLLLTLRLLPVYYDHYHIRQALRGLSDDGELAFKAPSMIRSRLVNAIKERGASHARAESLEILYEDNALILRLDYEDRVHYWYNVDLVISFAEEAKIGT